MSVDDKERSSSSAEKNAARGFGPGAGRGLLGGRGPGPGGPGRGGPMGMMPGEKARDFGGSLLSLKRYLSSHLALIAASLVLSAGSTVFAVLSPVLLGRVTTNVFGGPDFQFIAKSILVLSILYGLSSLLNWLQAFIMSGVSMKVSYSLRRDLEAKLHRLPLSYFDNRARGDILSVLTNDVDTVTQTLNQSLSQIISSVAMLSGILIMMAAISIPMTLASAIVLPLSLVFVQFIVRKSQPYFRKQQESIAALNGHVQEMYSCHSVVLAFGGESAAVKTFESHNRDLHASAWKSQFFSGLMMPVLGGIANIGYVVIALVGGFLAVRGLLSVGNIQAFVQYVRQFNQPIAQAANISNVLQSMAAAAERIFAFLGEAEEESGGGTAFPRGSVKGSVEFDDVRFSYVPGKPVIRGFSARVEPGMKVAIVGPTGAGKTTMVKLLMRFYPVESGSISVDGLDAHRLDRRDLRSAFGMVLQDTWLYRGSIRENIRYGRLDAGDEEVVEAASCAQADHFIRSLPGGYDFVINEDATNISRGEKQLLTIARAILADPPILILDEATSSVDSLTEVLIQKAMDSLMSGRTSFVIAHRLSTIKNADLVLVMKDGDVVEQGTHDSLLRKRGLYSELYESQFEPEEAPRS